MPTFQYTAKDRSGHTVIGVLEGASDLEVADLLHKKELIVVSVQPLKKKKARGIPSLLHFEIPPTGRRYLSLSSFEPPVLAVLLNVSGMTLRSTISPGKSRSDFGMPTMIGRPSSTRV